MELVESRRRRGGSTKTSRKGGKPHPALTAEEEARRREVVRERLELERRAVKVVERLLESNVSEDVLVDCARLITAANYRDAVEERFLAKLCGYPLCSTKLGKIPTQRYKISTQTNRVYDITERKCFCSNFCYKASKEFELQISTTPLWLRHHESPPEVTLLKPGDRGRYGEEVMLLERSLREDDIENPQASPLEDRPGSQQIPSGGDHGDGSEQEFVSSVLSQQQRPRVHWGDPPKPSDEGELRRKLRRGLQSERSRETGNSKEEEEPEEEDERKEPAAEELDTSDSGSSLCEDQHLPKDRGTETPAETKHGHHNAASSNQPGLSITQVGVSRRGAVGLRDLLKNHTGEPDSVPLSLLKYLKRTLKEWCTEETLKFLYGAGHSLVSTSSSEEVEQEELDEDDLEDEDDVMVAEQKRPSAPVPDCKTLQKETEQLEFRVREFYRGRWIHLEKEEEENRNEQVEVLDRTRKDPVLPLIDFNAQNLIQTKITLEKLSSCLRDIVGTLGLSMSDVCTELNNLVRTFRLTNTNIIHRTPEWTLLSVVLLHLLSEVSPVVLEALETSASVKYLNTLMEGLNLQRRDLLSLVQMFRPPSHMLTCTSPP
ncbi:putative RNA polymerase II subunit B1 CTD phosphatase rpap2 isoform X2 [Nothobranchius furzeri]|uniref:RNA polymerase II subunit B1 CTD phosphatase RPAP2 homolog n=1 Tax=Nothobranchius furzeri TaxID=105023 RepID=A0A1A8B029_NOTFU|nr:transcript variant X4 [Nothobranchius furzeri]